MEVYQDVRRLDARAALALSALLAASCASPSSDSPEPNQRSIIANGAVDSDGLYGFVVSVNSKTCTGTAISCRDILTAAHCVCAPYENANNVEVVSASFNCKSTATVAFQQTSSSSPEPRTGAVHVHPQFFTSKAGEGVTENRSDLAIITLDSAIPEWVQPAALPQSSPLEGQGVTLVGYGQRWCLGDAWDLVNPSGTRYFGANAIEGFLDDGKYFDQIITRDPSAHAEANYVLPFHGDSGGPLLAGDGTLLGVASTTSCSENFGSSDISGQGFYTRVDVASHSNWIRDTLSSCEMDCSDGIQNNAEEGVDCGGACPASCFPCQLLETCDNGQDDDCNGDTDCADSECTGSAACGCGAEGNLCCDLAPRCASGLSCDGASNVCSLPTSSPVCGDLFCEPLHGETCPSCASDCCLPAPTLVGPPDNASFAEGTDLTFSWNAVQGAKRYKVAVCPTEALTNCPVIEEPEVGVTTWTTSAANELHDGFWSVSAIPFDEGIGWGEFSLPARRIAVVDETTVPGWRLLYQPNDAVDDVQSIACWGTAFGLLTPSCVENDGVWSCDLPGDPGVQFQAWAAVTLEGGELGWSCWAPSSCSYTLRGDFSVVDPDGLVVSLVATWNGTSIDHCYSCNASVGTPRSCDPSTPSCDPAL